MHALHGIQAGNHVFAAAVVLLAHCLHLGHALEAGQRLDGSILRHGVGAGGHLALQAAHDLRNGRRRGRVADAPAGHRVGLGHAVDDDCLVVDRLAEGRDGRVLLAVIDELLVNLIGNHIEPARHGQLGDLAKLIAAEDRARRVARRVDQQHLRALGHKGCQIARLGDIVVLALRLHKHRHAARQADHLRIGNPARRGDDHLVAGVEQRAQRRIDGELRAVGNDNLGRRIGQRIVAQQLVADRLPQRQRARRRGVLGQAHIQRLMRCGTDVLGRHKVRLTGAEGDDITAIGCHLLGLRVDRQGRGRGNRAAHAGKFKRQTELLLRAQEYLK